MGSRSISNGGRSSNRSPQSIGISFVCDEQSEEERVMRWTEALQAVGDEDRSESFALFSRTLDIEWVRRALTASGSASVRKRKLPAESVVWLVIGMALLRDRSIDEV